MKVCCLTDIGCRREMNQDYFYSSEEPVGVLPNLFVIADGMGGHSAGDFASRAVVETMSDAAGKAVGSDILDILTDSVKQANAALREYAAEHIEMRGMGSTIVAAVLDGPTLFAVNVGDSRLYVVDDELRQITTDHSLVQEMLDRGEIDEETARFHPDRNIITRAVGAADKVCVATYSCSIKSGDIVLMCTDGMTNMVNDRDILETMKRPEDLLSNTERLVEMANQNGGKDNITVITIDPELER